MPLIQCESVDFPTHVLKNGIRDYSFTWDEMLWAALTVGRPNLYYVFRHARASAYEAIFRCSLVRMALEQVNGLDSRYGRTSIVKELDPTEKGAVNYFLGMIVCKIFADQLLKTPWLLHLDVFRNSVGVEFEGRSRPDLIGHDPIRNEWHAFECKGRLARPDATVKDNAKSQAARVVTVNGRGCALHVGAITYFSNDLIQFYWCDPEPEGQKPLELNPKPGIWQYYYEPLLDLIRADDDGYERMRKEPSLIYVEAIDAEVGIHPSVLADLVEGRWDDALRFEQSRAGSPVDTRAKGSTIAYRSDGTSVRAGSSWFEPLTRQRDVFG